MAVENLTATRRHQFPLVDDKQVPAAQGTNTITSTVEVTAAASATSTYWFHRLPAGARIMPGSKLYWDDLASTGSPTVDVGTFAVGANVTDDDDSLSDGHDVATGAGSAEIIGDVADYGKRVWELAGESANPGGFIDIKATIKDAATNTGGTMTMVIIYTVD